LAKANATVNITGFTSEQIATLLQAAGAAQQAKIDGLAVRLSTSREAVLGFFKILQQEDVRVKAEIDRATAHQHVGTSRRARPGTQVDTHRAKSLADTFVQSN
jgi:hypothetical protein